MNEIDQIFANMHKHKMVDNIKIDSDNCRIVDFA